MPDDLSAVHEGGWPLAWIEHQLARVKLLVRDLAPLELGKQRLEPERMLIKDPIGACTRCSGYPGRRRCRRSRSARQSERAADE